REPCGELRASRSSSPLPGPTAPGPRLLQDEEPDQTAEAGDRREVGERQPDLTPGPGRPTGIDGDRVVRTELRETLVVRQALRATAGRRPREGDQDPHVPLLDRDWHVDDQHVEQDQEREEAQTEGQRQPAELPANP